MDDTHDDRGSAHTGQPQKALSKPTRKKERDIRPPAVIPGTIYTRQDLMSNCGFDDARLTAWDEIEGEDGLHPLPTGTRNHLYYADHVIGFWLKLYADKYKKPKTKGK